VNKLCHGNIEQEGLLANQGIREPGDEEGLIQWIWKAVSMIGLRSHW
jgi:hypothetical protein